MFYAYCIDFYLCLARRERVREREKKKDRKKEINIKEKRPLATTKIQTHYYAMFYGTQHLKVDDINNRAKSFYFRLYMSPEFFSPMPPNFTMCCILLYFLRTNINIKYYNQNAHSFV